MKKDFCLYSDHYQQLINLPIDSSIYEALSSHKIQEINQYLDDSKGILSKRIAICQPISIFSVFFITLIMAYLVNYFFEIESYYSGILYFLSIILQGFMLQKYLTGKKMKKIIDDVYIKELDYGEREHLSLLYSIKPYMNIKSVNEYIKSLLSQDRKFTNYDMRRIFSFIKIEHPEFSFKHLIVIKNREDLSLVKHFDEAVLEVDKKMSNKKLNIDEELFKEMKKVLLKD